VVDLPFGIARSLRLRITAWLLLAVVGLALVVVVVSFVHEFHEQDQHLRQAVELADKRGSYNPFLDARPGPPDNRRPRMVVHFLSRPAPGSRISPSDSGPLVWCLPEGISTVGSGRDEWRVAVRTVDSETRAVVAQRSTFRFHQARRNLLLPLLPLVILVPLFLLLAGPLLDGIFRPLQRISDDLDHRRDNDLRTIALDGLPTEIHPFLVAINRLFGRVDRSVVLQRRFVADAAHELRTPLAALVLQAERLGVSELPAPARERLETLQAGILRFQGLVEQLLSHARSQDPGGGSAEPRSLREAVRSAFEDLLPLAETRRIDLGTTGETDFLVESHPADLTTLVRNLVENALKHSPEGGSVDVTILSDSNPGTLVVEDSGSGVALDERERVFEAFYRTPGTESSGSGLGLAIVKTIADRIGARIFLESREEGSGLRVRVEFPHPGITGGPAATG